MSWTCIVVVWNLSLVFIFCSVFLPAVSPCVISHETEFRSCSSSCVYRCLPALLSHVVVHHYTLAVIPCFVTYCRTNHLQYLNCWNSDRSAIFRLRTLLWTNNLASYVFSFIAIVVFTSSWSILKVHCHDLRLWECECFCICARTIISGYRIYFCIFILLCSVRICIRVSTAFVSLQIQLCLGIRFFVAVVITQIVWQDITSNSSWQIYTSEEHVVERSCLLVSWIKRFFYRSIWCIRQIVCYTCQRIVFYGVVCGHTVCHCYRDSI